MREIKFRAWDKKNRIFGSVIELSYTHNPDLGFVPSYVRVQNYNDLAEVIHYENPYKVQNDLVIEQFTGLYDKSGKEIYEGDIVQITITFNAYAPMKGAALWTTRKEIHPVKVRPGITTAGNLILYNYKSDEVQVIGNIHENK